MCRCGFFRSSARLRALSPSAEVLNIRLAYPISSVIGAGQPEDKARQGPPKKTSRQPVGPLRLAPAHSTLRIQECPQRQIFRAGACSVKKLLDIPYPWCARRMRDLAHVLRRSGRRRRRGQAASDRRWSFCRNLLWLWSRKSLLCQALANTCPI